MAGHLLNEVPDNRILLSKDLPGVVVAHYAGSRDVEVSCTGGKLNGNEGENESDPAQLLVGARGR